MTNEEKQLASLKKVAAEYNGLKMAVGDMYFDENGVEKPDDQVDLSAIARVCLYVFGYIPNPPQP